MTGHEIMEITGYKREETRKFEIRFHSIRNCLHVFVHVRMYLDSYFIFLESHSLDVFFLYVQHTEL